jgi:hypothetical protein
MNGQENLSFTLTHLSDHDRFLAQAQMARAEALVDAVAAAAALVQRGWSALAAPVRAWSAGRTRQWPHPQALRAGPIL